MPRTAAPRRPAHDEIEVTHRDFVMARLASARTSANEALAAIDETLGLFISPADDSKGKRRKTTIADALVMLGEAVSALECAEENIEDVDMTEGEPWEEDGDGEDEEEDDDTDEDE